MFGAHTWARGVRQPRGSECSQVLALCSSPPRVPMSLGLIQEWTLQGSSRPSSWPCGSISRKQLHLPSS